MRKVTVDPNLSDEEATLLILQDCVKDGILAFQILEGFYFVDREGTAILPCPEFAATERMRFGADGSIEDPGKFMTDEEYEKYEEPEFNIKKSKGIWFKTSSLKRDDYASMFIIGKMDRMFRKETQFSVEGVNYIITNFDAETEYSALGKIEKCLN